MTKNHCDRLNPGSAEGPHCAQTLQRGLSARHIQLISIGGAIGTGLFMGAGKTLALSGTSIVLTYAIVGFFMFMVMRAMGELLLTRLDYRSFADFVSEYLGPRASFFLGWSYWLSWVVTCIADVVVCGGYVQYWLPNVSPWLPALLTLGFLCLFNMLSVKMFGEAEFWFAMIKVVAIVALIATGAWMVFSGWTSPDGVTASLHNVTDPAIFMPHGIFGFFAGFQIAIFSCTGIELLGTMSAETKNPEKVLPKAINAVPVRILLFYVLTLTVLMAIYPWNSIGQNGSPFVEIFSNLGISSAANVLNVVVITAAISAINSDIFGAGRMMYGMAQDGQAPRSFTKLTASGVPWMTVLVMSVALLLAVVLNYLIPEKVFMIIASIATFATVWVWLMILLSQIVMRRTLSPEETRQLSFPVPWWPVAPALATAFMAFVIGLLGYFEESRIALYVGLVWIAFLTAAYWLWVRKKGGGSPVTTATQQM
ncbi:amino acid permease [Serratia marcescens]|nr:amino acid permease [Serratia marcescens]RTF88976.1 amino acid permease [Serratia marcescens]